MLGNRVNRHHWTDWYPVEDRLLTDFANLPGSEHNTDGIFLVDLGGGLGRDVKMLLAKFPQTRNRLVLQDLHATAESAKDIDPGIHVIGHDFFNPQPIIGKSLLSPLFFFFFLNPHS
jgi:hypothetical protein